ncbi:MAG: FecR domain-containing protein [Archangiaceae bacterium]|nr:FecR domain-containing protein [Archangiaceae bacterium]
MRPLRDYLEREVDDGAIDAHWAAASERLDAARRPTRRWVAPALAAAAAVLIVAGVARVTLRHTQQPLSPGQALLADAATVAQLPDGSQVELAFGAGVKLVSSAADLIEIEVSRGTATFDVVKRPARRFVVRADDVTVTVVGTRFTVKRDGADTVEVAIERGQVDVRAQGIVKRLAAGEQWRGHSVDAASGEGAAREPIIEGLADPRGSDVVEVELPEEGDGPGANEAKPPRPHHRHKVRVPRRKVAAAPAGAAVRPRRPPPPRPPTPTSCSERLSPRAAWPAGRSRPTTPTSFSPPTPMTRAPG